MEKGNGFEGGVTRSTTESMNVANFHGEDNESSIIRTLETFLRLIPIGLCVTALVIMLKNSEQNDYGSLSYTDLAGFRFLVHANGICAGYSLLSAVFVALPRPSTMPRAWTFFFFDQVLTYIILAAGAASTEVLYLADKGNTATTWSAACGSFGSFCHKGTASVAITFAAMFCYVMLSLISSYKLFSKYDAPMSNPVNAKGIDIVASHG
ncbi:hypothetical protein PIB30_076037 [Stylosanthes scabra]|uniref:CASP-like protein n=1 Tax=Stylosanthes scabra TaxID=79078 RepID=A0ABU6RQQ1_9FABA|nr:hypothetical protein [Stylosanthes scabra]